jgi:hypothetical protein
MHDPYSYLQEQECMSPSGSVMETSYASSDDGGSPWSGLTSIARQVAHTINRSAKSLINELAELEYEARARSGSYDSDASELESFHTSHNNHNHTSHNHNHHTSHNHHDNHHKEQQQQQRHRQKQHHNHDNITTTILPLPWEICLQSTDVNLKISIVQKEDEPLKEKIMALSKDESVFTGPFNEKNTNEDDSSVFTLDDSRVVLIRRLLEIDHNLGYIHAKVSGRSTMKEKVFWMNYFFHCEKLRETREKEINDESLRRALHDDELDAELVGRPPACCTGFYPRTGKLSLQDINSSSSTDSSSNFHNSHSNNSKSSSSSSHNKSNSQYDDRVIPALPNMDCMDDFVMIYGTGGLEDF